MKHLSRRLFNQAMLGLGLAPAFPIAVSAATTPPAPHFRGESVTTTAEGVKRIVQGEIAHECRCRWCAPTYFPAYTERLHLQHIAIRLNSGVCWTAKVNGVDISKFCNEAFAGQDGLVVIFTPSLGKGKKHCCTCGHGACQQVLRGNVEVEPYRISKTLSASDRLRRLIAKR